MIKRKANTFIEKCIYGYNKTNKYKFHDKRKIEVFKEFMNKRFPEEKEYLYIQEWICRFMTDNPEVFMDVQSRLIYQEVLKNHQK